MFTVNQINHEPEPADFALLHPNCCDVIYPCNQSPCIIVGCTLQMHGEPNVPVRIIIDEEFVILCHQAFKIAAHSTREAQERN